MAKVYISGKITGDDNYIDKFVEAEERLRKQGYETINPAAVNMNLPESTTWEEYMSVSIALLDMCDAIYMLKDWKDSRGACLEYGYALAKKLKVIWEE